MFLEPQFFDILGFLAFLYVIVISAWTLWIKSSVPRILYIILFLIGVAGLLVDALIVYNFFLR